MSKSKNSGLIRQDAILGQFKQDAKRNQSGSATAQAIRSAKKVLIKRSNQEEIRFVFGTEAHREWIQSQRDSKVSKNSK